MKCSKNRTSTWAIYGLAAPSEEFRQMSKTIGIIVDGQGDFASLKKRFAGGYKIIKTDGPRGDSAAPSEIAIDSKKQIGMLKAFKCKRIIVMLDIEERRESYDEFFNKLSECFHGFDLGVQISIAVPNKMIENWYLADIEYLSRRKAFLKDGIKQKNFEGMHGKKELKKFFAKNIQYRETRHGAQMFAILRFDVARNNSPSLDHFLTTIRQ